MAFPGDIFIVFLKDFNQELSGIKAFLQISEEKDYVVEPQYDKTNKITVRPAKTQISPWHPPNLIRVFAVRSVG